MSLTAGIRKTFDRFIGGRGEFSITVPVMDGALKPNDYLERAAALAVVEQADNAVVVGEKLLISSGSRVLELRGDGDRRVHSEHDAPISCLGVSHVGALAIGLDGVGVKIAGGRYDGTQVDRVAGMPLICPTAAIFLAEDLLLVSNGSATFPAAQWSHDLIHHGRSGSVVRIDLSAGKAVELAGGLSFPAGLSVRHDTSDILVTEAWRHRLLIVETDAPSAPREVLAGLPAYPGRICRSAAGGYWLSFLAARSQLQEFVLREDRFRRRMIAEIDPAFWIAPTLSSGHSFKEPLQAGGVIRLGIHKPWAPTRSYGLVVRLDADLQPVWSAHSRADGTRHGITSLAEVDGELVVTSKGKGEVVLIDHVALAEPLDLMVPTEHAA
ncbi:strictosidine synthase [Mesorhizobium sp. L-8-3]|uniref:strictosidine synthase n=1 Tax=Mesorhizobium sp. L-8-3 TaxID=2744522 RepID=UPI0019271699|nr:strictosidine synthase [Mesorhizobium sp. L-8-3]BCH23631.1 NHL repeat containing protein [Mesorhizobium sp. L-8-3]